jgi:GNAT superfamily N-acetyltransferase
VSVLIRRFLDVARAFGVGRAVRLAPAWFLTRRYLVFAWDLRQVPAEVPAPDGVSCTLLTPAEEPALGELDPLMSPGEIRRRVAEGQECVVGWVDGTLVYYRWQSTEAVFVPHIRNTLHPCAGDVIVLDVFTSPRFRGRGIGEFAARRALVRARAMGLRRALWLVAWWNAPALRIARHPEHCRCMGTVGYVNLGPFRRHFATGHVRLAPDGVHVEPGPWPLETR